MKHVIALILGVAAGAAAAIAFLYHNPFTSHAGLSPLLVSDRPQLVLNYSAIGADSILYTNDGESIVQPHPEKVLQLWEPPIRLTETMVTMLRDGRDTPAGIGIKFSSRSERTRILNGEVLVDSAWYVYLPQRGSLLIAQHENHWNYLREVVARAHLSSGDNWKGSWHGRITNGPGALGTAHVYGGSGTYRDLELEAIETLSAQAYSTVLGPVALDGQLTIELPATTDESATAANSN